MLYHLGSPSSICKVGWEDLIQDVHPSQLLKGLNKRWACAIKKDSLIAFTTTWMDLEDITLSEISQTKINTIWFHLYVEDKLTQGQREQISGYHRGSWGVGIRGKGAHLNGDGQIIMYNWNYTVINYYDLSKKKKKRKGNDRLWGCLWKQLGAPWHQEKCLTARLFSRKDKVFSPIKKIYFKIIINI